MDMILLVKLYQGKLLSFYFLRFANFGNFEINTKFDQHLTSFN